MGVVLIVDDDAQLRRAFERVVTALGHQALTAESVAAALAVVDRQRIDLVLTDWQMAPDDGLMLLRALRTRTPSLPVVLMSGALDPTVRETALRIGAAAAVEKPQCFQWLRTSLAETMASSSPAGEPRSRRGSGRSSVRSADDVMPRVLIIEDDEDIRDAIAVVVEREGCEAVTVSHGLEALRYLKTCDRLPSVILLDLMMPVMDGWEFLRRRDERVRAVPVVVITAGPAAGLPDDIRCLRKPLSVEALAGELRPCWTGGDER